MAEGQRNFTPALPFCHFVLKAEKPKESGYPKLMITIGERLRARRLDLGLFQKDVAVLLGVTEDSVCYWEKGRVKPSNRLLLKVIQFINGKGSGSKIR
jgi:DNA-binding transcriptional regulator YiaG